MRRTHIFMVAILLAAPAPLSAQDSGAADTTEQRDNATAIPALGSSAFGIDRAIRADAP